MRLSYEDLLADIYDAGEGPEIAAFFDFDRTLIQGYSVMSVMQEQIRGGDMSWREFSGQAGAALKYSRGQLNFSGLVAETAASLRGQAEYVMEELGERIFKKKLAGAIYPEAREIVETHQELGHTVAIVSSATKYQIEPAAREMGIDYILCTDLEIKDGIFTGEVVRPTCFGQGKRDAAEDFCEDFDADMEQSFFYTDSDDDLPLLEAVGHPRVVNPNSRLAKVAEQRSWPVSNFTSRGGVTLTDVAKTGAIYASMPAAMLATLPLWALTGRKRDALNAGMSLWAEFATALAGLKLDVGGEGHLWSHRPAVFVFNHQSSMDALIVAKLLAKDFTGIGKKEIANFPVVGPLFRFGDVILIDRSNTEKAIEAMKPVRDAVQKEGLSVTLAPEGTRSPGKQLGPFKKGAFHIAMQAEVPMVPIVIHNANDSLPKGRNFPRPATVHVTVLPPVDTSHWSPDTITEHIADVRQMFLDELGQEDA